MHQLSYTSWATQPLTSESLVHLLTQARAKNERLQITGLLLYGEQRFLQVLEGEQAVVDRLYQCIIEDPRHQHVTRLTDRPIMERRFAAWSMAFQGVVDSNVTALSGYVFPEQLPLGAEQQSAVDWVLTRFMRDLVLPPPIY